VGGGLETKPVSRAGVCKAIHARTALCVFTAIEFGERFLKFVALGEVDHPRA
jgi:hypothetical protein